MLQHRLLPNIREVLESIRQKSRIEVVVGLILEKACALAGAAHGSFMLVDNAAGRLTIANVSGSDWTVEKRLCQLAIGQGLTGKVAATGEPLLCQDTAVDPDYYQLFDYVRSELVVPVIVKDRVWGVINIDAPDAGAFGGPTLEVLTLFAELAAFAITMRLEMTEQDKIYQKLLQSEKLASLGEALAGIAHEINNPLTAILGHASLLDVSRGDAANRLSADIINSEAQRAADLIRGLLEFSRKETGKREIVHVSNVIKQVIALKTLQLKRESVKILVSTEGDPLPVMVCPQQIKQVLLNLITNAEQAFPEDCTEGTIHISLSSQAGEVVVTVTDNGCGIPADATKFIFDPFFTTKPTGQGTGLGLSIAYAIMEAHGGSITLTSSTSAGTTFTLTLPQAEVPALEATPAHQANIAVDSGGLGGKILLVDDEPAILESLAAYLSTLNLNVALANNGEEALDLLRGESFDLVVSDMRMPGIDGTELYYAACRINSLYEKRFVFMSGYLMRDRIKSFLAGTGITCLEKPFSFDLLRRTISPFLTTPMFAAENLETPHMPSSR